MIAAIRIPTPEEIKARRARLGFGPANVNRKPKPEPVVNVVDEKQAIASADVASRELLQEDEHVHAWWAWRAWIGDEMSLMNFIKSACYLAGTSLDEVRGRRGDKPMILRRHAVIKSACVRFPDVSTTKMGKMVNRDHTVIVYVMNHKTKMKGERPRKARRALTEADVREIRATVSKGGPYEPAAQKYGVSYSTIFYIVDRQTWKHIE